MASQETTVEVRDRERGAALLLAVMVALVLVFLGMGLLLQTNLGLQAAASDRWVVKALYAADAGAMLQVQMLQARQLAPISGFTLSDDRNMPGLLHTDFNVAVTELCEAQSPVPMLPPDPNDPNAQVFQLGFVQRYFYLRSEATRTIGNLGGVANTAVAVHATVWPFDKEQLVAVGYCWK